MTAGNFQACLTHILRSEGGYVDHLNDPGGATNKGITRKTLAKWRGVLPWNALPKAAVEALTDEEAGQIYRAQYWDVCGAEKVTSGLDLALFDFAVNSGPSRALRHMQALLGVKTDGVMGPKTLSAITYFDQKRRTPALIKGLCRSRLKFLRQLQHFPQFGRGWQKRVANVEKTALAMYADHQKTTAQPQRNPKMNILNGYKTYIVGALMLLSGLAQLAGVDLPGFDGQSAAQLLMEGFAIVFLRKGFKADLGKTQ